jgi:DNA processing protein
MMAEQQVSSTHPLPHPNTEDDRLVWLRLLRSHRVGISTFFKLMAEHGCAKLALEMLPEIAQQAGMKNYVACSVDRVEDEMRASALAQAKLIFSVRMTIP